MDINHMVEAILEEMKKEIDQWMAYINDNDAEKTVKRTTLQTGIHGYALLEYADGRVNVTDNVPDQSLPGNSKQNTSEQLTEEQVRKLIPELAAYMQHHINTLPRAVIDYRFTFDGKFRCAAERSMYVFSIM